MKFIQSILLIGILFLTGSAFGQREVVEDTIIVKGICGMCKQRIEEAAYGKGVKSVQWDLATDKLALAYRPDKTTLKEIEDRILEAGHSTGTREAGKEAYDKLPKCCRYEELGKH